MKKLYGSLNNRLEENKNFTGRQIQEGDDITMYYWSDRHCYYITKVIDQNHIFVKPYHICANHDMEPQMGHQNWMYFKTIKEKNEYLNKYFPESELNLNPEESKEIEWVFRNGSWKEAIRFTQKDIERIEKTEGWCRLGAKNEKEQKLLDSGKEVVHYLKLEPISFGVKEYYYDWEF